MVPKPLTIQIAGQSPINQAVGQPLDPVPVTVRVQTQTLVTQTHQITIQAKQSQIRQKIKQAVEKAMEQMTAALRQQIQKQETMTQQRQHQIMVFQVIVKHLLEQRMKTQLILEQHQEVMEVKELLDARKDQLHPQVVVLQVQVGLKDQHQWIRTP